MKFRKINEAYDALIADKKPRQTKQRIGRDFTAQNTEKRRKMWNEVNGTWGDSYQIYLKSIRGVFEKKLKLRRSLQTDPLFDLVMFKIEIARLGACAAARSKVAKRHFVMGVLLKAKQESSLDFVFESKLIENPEEMPKFSELDITPFLFF